MSPEINDWLDKSIAKRQIISSCSLVLLTFRQLIIWYAFLKRNRCQTRIAPVWNSDQFVDYKRKKLY